MTGVVRLRPGRDKSLLRRHPWVFSGAIERVQGDPADGETVRLEDAGGQFLAWGAFSSKSQIRARIWSRNEHESIDQHFLRLRLERSIRRRDGYLIPGETDAVRLVHGESDGLPGLVVDRYGDVLVAQFLSSGVDYWKQAIADALVDLVDVPDLYERSDADVRRLEGLPECTGPLRGRPVQQVVIYENGLQFRVDIAAGHKTGYYLDQRENRRVVRKLAGGKDVLDCFSYSGGFLANALAGGAASVLAVDSSADALALSREHVALNRLPEERADWLETDVFQTLRRFRDSRRNFDLIILDPPKFAPTAAQARQAARGYKDINLLAFKLLRPGGVLVTFSCSGGVDADLFQKIVAGAALDAGVEAQIISRLYQGPDHPVSLHFPEGSYLKGLVIRLAGND